MIATYKRGPGAAPSPAPDARRIARRAHPAAPHLAAAARPARARGSGGGPLDFARPAYYC